MGGFPALPSGNNPYAASAAGYASSAASVFNAIRSAANQHQQQKAAADAAAARQAVTDRQEYAKETQSLREKGFVPRTVTNPGIPLDGMRDEAAGEQVPNPAMSGADQNLGDFHTDSKGNAWLPPAKLDETNSIPLNDELRAEAKKYNIDLPAGNARAPLTLIDKLHTAAETHRLEHPEAPAETFEYDDKNFVDPQTGQRVLTMKGNRGTVKRAIIPQDDGQQQGGGRPGGAFDGQAQAAPVPAGQSPFSMMDYLTKNPIGPPADVLNGLPAGDHTFENGQTWRKGHDGSLKFSPPDKADKPARTRVDLTNFNQPVSVDEDSGEIKPLKLPPGVSRAMSPAQVEADKDRHVRLSEIQDGRDARKETREQGDRDRAQKQIDVFQTREQEEHQKASEYGKVLAQPNTNSKESNQLPVVVIDPRTGRETPMTEERRAYFQGQYNKSKAMADTWHQQGVKLVQRYGGDTGEAAPAAQPASPGRGGRGGGAAPVTPAAPAAKVAPAAAAPAAAAPAKTAAPAIAEGTIIRNPQTGARQILRGGQWKPL